MNTLKKKYKFMIINGKVESTADIKSFKVKYPYGLPVLVDDYEMGICHWSLIENEADAAERQLLDNVFWAVERLPWAIQHSQEEIKYLKEVILSGGKSRQ